MIGFLIGWHVAVFAMAIAFKLLDRRAVVAFEPFEHLIQACVEAEAAGRDVQLVVMRSSPPRGNVRLAGRFGPLSKEIACVQKSKRNSKMYDIVAWFDATKVRELLEDYRENYGDGSDEDGAAPGPD